MHAANLAQRGYSSSFSQVLSGVGAFTTRDGIVGDSWTETDLALVV